MTTITAPLHLSPDHLARLQSPTAPGAAFVQRYADAVERYLIKTNLFEHTRPGGTTLTVPLINRCSHMCAALHLFHGIRPERPIHDQLISFLRWTLEQENMIIAGAFLLGHFLKGYALVFETLGDRLPEDLKLAVFNHLKTRLIDAPKGHAPTLEIPGLGFHLLDEQVNNWDGLGAMGLYYAAMMSQSVFGETTPDAQRWLNIADIRFRRFLKCQFTAQGEYGEGPSYYSYGTHAAVLTLDLLEHHANQPPLSSLSPIPASALKGLHASGQWSREIHPHGAKQGPFNFNDSSTGVLETSTVLHWIANQTQDPAIQQYADELFDLRMKNIEKSACQDPDYAEQDLEQVGWTVLFRDNALPARQDQSSATYNFGRFGTIISRTGYTTDDLILLFRCGDPAGAHSHADAGSFTFDAFGERIVAEGGKPYDRSIPQYNTYHRQAYAHNIPFIDDQPQHRENGGQWFGGKITSFEQRPDGFAATCDLSNMYLGDHHVTRRFIFSQSGWILVHDTVTPATAKLTTLLHTDNQDRKTRITLDPRHTLIERPRATMHLFPLLSSDLRDKGSNFHDSDPEGIRTLEIQGTRGEAAYLLVITPTASPTPVTLTPATDRKFDLAIGDTKTRIEL